MNAKRSLVVVMVLALVACVAPSALGTPITVASYVCTPAPESGVPWTDTVPPSKLIDGFVGTVKWTGFLYWPSASPTVTFQFGQLSTVGKITVSYWGDDGGASVYAPASIKANFSTDGGTTFPSSVTWSSLPTAYGNNTVPLSVPTPGKSANCVRLDITRRGGTVMSEVAFASYVPPITVASYVHNTARDASYADTVPPSLLTNGIVATSRWTGFVGWVNTNPDSTFHLGQLSTVSTITVSYWGDRAGDSVYAPESLTATFSTDGIHFGNSVTWGSTSFTTVDGNNTVALDLPSGVNATDVRLVFGWEAHSGHTNTETMISEVAFNGNPAVPEPACLGLVGMALLALRRRRK